MTSSRTVLLSSLICLGGCASTPDPADVCSAEWIEPRAERAMERLESRTAKAFRALRRVGADYVAGDTPGPFALLRLRNAVEDLEDEFRHGRGAKDLRLLARTCDDPDLVRNAVSDLLARQNVPDRVVSFLRSSTLLDRMIDIASRETDAQS